ncbi:hypothetical protein EDB85DRAFT_1869147 [Lactarius pseudohatsudake]|nr:hypothetical protein EDB85DRAFT_1869147 [Lactarius pseudohatsudake]
MYPPSLPGPPSTSGSIPSTRAPSPALSDATSSSRAYKRPRRSDSLLSHQASFPGYEPGWSQGEQAMFETAVTRLTASAGLPLRWVENPEWLALCERFLPNAKSPSRKVLTQRLIPATLKGFKQTARKQCSGFEGTVSYDGWTGGNHHHYVAFMNHVIRVHDASGERKTAENLFPELEKVLSDLQQSWNITVVAITSDAGGDALKGRKMAHRKYPHIVVPDCFGHQVR